MVTVVMMEAKIPISWFLVVFCFQAFRCDNINFQLLLRKMRLIRKVKYHSGFDERIPLRIRTTKGAIGFLTCIVKNIENETVSWIRNQDLQILTVDNYVFTGDKRFEIINETPTNWTLKINNVRVEDTGIYDCQISTQPIKSFSVYLSVSDDQNSNIINRLKDTDEKQNIDLVNDEVAELRNTARAYHESTRILESPEIYLKEGDTLSLTCEVDLTRRTNNRIAQGTKNVPSFRINLVWFHDQEIISQNTSHDGTSVITKNFSTIIRSKLLILHTFKNDSGSYFCIPFPFNKAMATVHITSGNQLQVPANILIYAMLMLSCNKFINLSEILLFCI